MERLLAQAHRRKEVGVAVFCARRKFNNAMFCAVMAFTIGLALPGIATNHLAAEPVASGGAPEKTTLIPYGCTKFRISMFPITERAWKAFVLEKP
jgi:hypothetical protein